MSANNEKINHNPDNVFESVHDAGQERADTLREAHEKAGERAALNNEKGGERARLEALENALSVERQSLSKEKTKAPSPAKRRGAISKHDLDANYKRTINQVQTELSAPSRTFSKVIHIKPIEKTSDILEATVARPNAILAGAIGAFIVTLALYVIAKNFGYRLSGFETIGGFILGWIFGLLFDYFKVMITGKRP